VAYSNFHFIQDLGTHKRFREKPTGASSLFIRHFTLVIVIGSTGNVLHVTSAPVRGVYLVDGQIEMNTPFKSGTSVHIPSFILSF
jgi:hypothetical protein